MLPDSDKLNQEEIIKLIENLNKNINELSSNIQKFGLDLITKLGQTNSKIQMLTDKIEKLDKTTLDIKALQPKLNNIIDNQTILESDIELIKSLIQRTSTSYSPNHTEIEKIERDESITINKKEITNKFKDLLKFIEESNDLEKIKNNLEKLKERIFELTGGHKILYEISQCLSKMNNPESSSDTLKNQLKEKIEFWIVKF